MLDSVLSSVLQFVEKLVIFVFDLSHQSMSVMEVSIMCVVCAVLIMPFVTCFTMSEVSTSLIVSVVVCKTMVSSDVATMSFCGIMVNSSRMVTSSIVTVIILTVDTVVTVNACMTIGYTVVALNNTFVTIGNTVMALSSYMTISGIEMTNSTNVIIGGDTVMTLSVSMSIAVTINASMTVGYTVMAFYIPVTMIAFCSTVICRCEMSFNSVNSVVALRNVMIIRGSVMAFCAVMSVSNSKVSFAVRLMVWYGAEVRDMALRILFVVGQGSLDERYIVMLNTVLGSVLKFVEELIILVLDLSHKLMTIVIISVVSIILSVLIVRFTVRLKRKVLIRGVIICHTMAVSPLVTMVASSRGNPRVTMMASSMDIMAGGPFVTMVGSTTMDIMAGSPVVTMIGSSSVNIMIRVVSGAVNIVTTMISVCTVIRTSVMAFTADDSSIVLSTRCLCVMKICGV